MPLIQISDLELFATMQVQIQFLKLFIVVQVILKSKLKKLLDWFSLLAIPTEEDLIQMVNFGLDILLHKVLICYK